MRAFAITEFGQPGSILELPDPVASTGEVLILVRAASVNAYDAVAASGGTRSFAETRLPFIPGLDAAGLVEDVGVGVDSFTAGDAVFTNAGAKPYWGGGIFAELVSVAASEVIATPANLSFSAAATIPQTGLTALGAVDALEPSTGDVILVTGATGGAGGWFTQIAADRGARIVALVRPENAEYALSLGATDAVDYAAADLIETLRGVLPDGADGLADFSGNKELIEQLSALIRNGGRLTTSATRLDADGYAARGLKSSQANKVSFARIPELLELISSGRIKPPINDRDLVGRGRPGDRVRRRQAQPGQGRHSHRRVRLSAACPPAVWRWTFRCAVGAFPRSWRQSPVRRDSP